MQFVARAEPGLPPHEAPASLGGRYQQVSRDADDDAVLACALAARADLVVSGDADLLVLDSFRGIGIVTVAQAL